MPERARLFLALWPDEEVRSEIAAAIVNLDVSGRVTAAGNLHVTLVFLGAVDPARRPCVDQALASIEASAAEFALTQVQWRRRDGMLWLTAPDVPAALSDLVTKLRAALVPCGHTPKRRPYRLHVTVARNVRRFARGYAFAPIRWCAVDFCLVSSKPTPDGSQYTIERRWPLPGVC